MQIIIYVLCFDDASESKARRNFGMYSWARPLRIETTLWLEGIMYESWLMAHEAEWADCDYVGTIAYSIFSKIRIFSLSSLYNKIQKSDIFAFYKRSENLIATAGCPHFRVLWVDMLTRLGFTEAEAVDPTVEPFYCNYWIARPAIMREYCDFYRRAQGALKASALQTELWSDTGYSNRNYSNADWCRRTFGVPHYTHHVFLMERLPCFFAHKRYRVESIPNQIGLYKEKILYLVMFSPQSAADCRNKEAIAAYASMFPNIQLLFICGGAHTSLARSAGGACAACDTLTVQSACAIDTLIGALTMVQTIAFDYVICSDASVALDFSAMPSFGGAHYSGPALSGPHIWGGCLTLSKDGVTILMIKPVDKTLSPDAAIGSIMGKYVLPFQTGSIARIGAVPTGAYCYVPLENASEHNGLEQLVAQFERPAICASDAFNDDPKMIATKLIRNLFASAIASMGDMSAAYSGAELLDRLGLPLHYGSRWSAEPPVSATEDMVLAWLRGAALLPAAINLRDCSLRSRESIAWLRAYVRVRAEDVRAANPFRARYGNNNDVFVYATASMHKLALAADVSGFVWAGPGGDKMHMSVLAAFPGLIAWEETDIIRTMQFAITCRHHVFADDEFSILISILMEGGTNGETNGETKATNDGETESKPKDITVVQP